MAQRSSMAVAVKRRRVLNIRFIRRDRMWLSLVHVRSSRQLWLYLVRGGLAALSRVAPELSACCA